MASAFGHAIAAFAIGKNYSQKIRNLRFWLLGVICTILPDVDVIAFKFGIPYEHVLGHRGFSHSILFAFFTGLTVTFIFFKNKNETSTKIAYVSFFTLCTISHSLLDALTNGGLGVAFFAPFENSRYFFPWRPIQVSPIGVGNFFSEWGWRVIKSELIWIGIPCLLYITAINLVRKVRQG